MANLFEPGLYLTTQEQDENLLTQKQQQHLQAQPQLQFLSIKSGHLVHVLFTFSDGNSLCENTHTKKVGLIESKKLYKLLDNQVVFIDSIYNENIQFIEFNQIFKPVFVLIVNDSLFCYHEDESLNFNFRIQDSRINDCLDELVAAPLAKTNPRVDSGIELGGNYEEFLGLLKGLGGDIVDGDIGDGEYNSICNKIQGHLSVDSGGKFDFGSFDNGNLNDFIENIGKGDFESDIAAARLSSSFAAGHKEILTPYDNKTLPESAIDAQKEILAALGELRSKLVVEHNTFPISTAVPNQEKGPLDAMQAFVQQQQLTAEILQKHQKNTAQKIREVDEKIARGIHSFMAVTKSGYECMENLISSNAVDVVKEEEKTVALEESKGFFSSAKSFLFATTEEPLVERRLSIPESNHIHTRRGRSVTTPTVLETSEPLLKAQMVIPQSKFLNLFENLEIESMLCKQRLLYDDERISGNVQIDDSDSDFDEDDNYKVCGWLVIESICLQMFLHTLFG